MNLRIPVIVSVLLGCALCMGCGGDDDDDDAALTADCQKICSMTEPLNCPEDPDDCVGNCKQEANALPKCKSAVAAALACSAKRPASDYACDPDSGEAELSDTVCTDEVDAVAVCYLTPSEN